MNVCIKCKQIKSVHTFVKCNHSLCRKCFQDSNIKESNFTHCLVNNCNSEIFDSDIRKMMDDIGYEKIVSTIKENPKTKIPNPGWICIFCTFINLPYIKFCTVCQSNRPDDYKVPSYYKITEEESKEVNLERNQEEREKKIKEKEEKEIMEKLELLKKLSKQEVTMTTENSDCPVCMLEYGPGEAVVLHSCLHTICKDCLKNYLVSADHPKIKCPTENCMGQIEDREIEKMLTPKEYEKYQQLSLRTAEATEKFSFHCKGVNCTAWIVHDGMVDNFKCPLCRKVNCIKCNVIHENMDCSAYKRSISGQTISLDTIYFENLLKNGDAMICSGCKIIVEKDQGCDWIQCRVCKTELCWATKGPRWGPNGHGDTSGGCRCRVNKVKCHPLCRYCH